VNINISSGKITGNVVQNILDLFEKYAELVPLQVFVFFGAFLEEVIAPIPSPFVMTLAGSVAQSQGYAFWYLFVVATIASTGKTIGAIFLYWLADKAEDLVLSRFGKFVGITHKEVEKFGQKLSGTNRDFLTLLVIRSTPVIPSAPVSLICGFIKVDKKQFIVATFLGTIIRDFVYLYFGYTSLEAAASIVDGIEGAQSLITIALALVGAAVVGWIIYKKKFSDDDKNESA
jgi:membrane protein DedA with SNARE-associated domain